VYVPQAQWVWAETTMTVVIRSSGDPGALVASVRDIVRSIDPAQPITNVRGYDAIFRARTGTRRFAAALLVCFAASALALAVAGLYGALGTLVGQRRREIGVRLALGAGASAIRRMILGLGVKPALAGLAAGLTLAVLAAGTLESLVYGVRTVDPATYVGVAALVAGASLLACLLPALRASRITPAEVLRSE
jgi:ABC-type antimicrobial peptide transport system permease subunit